MSEFRAGITPDPYEQVKGRAESIIEENLSPAAGVICERMPPAPDKTAAWPWPLLPMRYAARWRKRFSR